MQEGTRLKLEELRRLLKAEPQPISMERAEELFRKAFPGVSDSYKGISKYKNKYPKYFKGINIAAITDDKVVPVGKSGSSKSFTLFKNSLAFALAAG